MTKVSTPSDPKPPEKGTIYRNLKDDALYIWNGKRWINLEKAMTCASE